MIWWLCSHLLNKIVLPKVRGECLLRRRCGDKNDALILNSFQNLASFFLFLLTSISLSLRKIFIYV